MKLGIVTYPVEVGPDVDDREYVAVIQVELSGVTRDLWRSGTYPSHSDAHDAAVSHALSMLTKLFGGP